MNHARHFFYLTFEKFFNFPKVTNLPPQYFMSFFCKIVIL